MEGSSSSEDTLDLNDDTTAAPEKQERSSGSSSKSGYDSFFE